MAACPTLLLLGDVRYYYSNSFLVSVADWKVRGKARWSINVSGSSGVRNQIFIKEWHLLLDCKAKGPRLAAWAACSAASEGATQKCCHLHLLGSQCWHAFLFLIRVLEALFTSHHLLSFCSQFIASSSWGTQCLEGPETCSVVGWNKDNVVLYARKYCPVRCFLFLTSMLSSWLVLPNFLALFPWLPQGSRMRCMHDREVRGCEDVTSWQ